MREKKAGRIIILVAFILICLSNLVWFFTKKYANLSNNENREMAAKPSFSVDGYETFSKDYTAYFNDNLQFRNDLITLNTEIDYFIYNKSTIEEVIAGSNNWLFYARDDDGDPISCYHGTNLYNNEELQALAENCIRQRDFLSEQGKEFVIFIAPNKERMYNEYMPYYYGQPAPNYRALQVYQYLKENTDLRVVYPYDDLVQAKNDAGVNIYFKTDTHWNNIGAYIGARSLCKELGIELPSLTSEEITITKGNHTSGDLAQMLNLKKQLEFADFSYSVAGYNTHNMEMIESNYNEAFIYHATDADPRKIYIIRDSFLSAMAPYIGSQFTDSYLMHHRSYSYENLVEQNPDIVVYETVERYVGNLMGFSIQ